MRRVFTILIALLVATSAVGQEIVDDYRLYKIDEVEYNDPLMESDTLLFYRAVHRSRDLFDEVTAYRFSFLSYARRGIYYTEREARLNGIGVRHANLSLLRRLGLTERGYAGTAHGGAFVGGMAGADEFSSTDGVPLSGGTVGMFFSGKGYLGGVRAGVNSLMRGGWSMSLYASARGGNDLYVEGVYNNSVDVGVRLQKDFQSGATLSLVALTSVGERGLRSGSTEEAFTLTGDNLYNPSWGYQSGKVRNSRIRRDAVPFVVATYTRNLGQATRAMLSFGGDYGHRRYSTLGWYDAMTPRPDNYRYMPSYYPSPSIADAVAAAWRSENPHYTQIRWDDMYRQNRMTANEAIYAMDFRVERIARGEALLHFESEVAPNLLLRYGLRGLYNSSRNYKQMEDLMGATHLVDIDYYLTDDDTFSRYQRNNLRDGYPTVSKGDRFSYDYDLRSSILEARLGLEYASERWLVEADVTFGGAEIVRKGYFEKELFAGSGSYGRSERLKFNPYVVKASAGYTFSPRHHLRVGAMVGEVLPDAENMFLNPLYNNRTVDNPVAERHLAVEMEYKYTSAVADMILTAYYNSTRDERQTMRLYDDLSQVYSDVDISRLGCERYGVEASAEVRFASFLRASFSAAVGRYCYANNPLVAYYSDYDNSVITTPAESLVGGCRLGEGPQMSATAELTYLDYKGWVASMGVQVAAQRYVEPSLLRRTERVAIQGSSSEEIYRRFIDQRRLNDVATLDASLSRWFNVGHSRLSLTLSVRNLLGSRNIVYGGYESSRIRNYRSGSQRIYLPQDDVLTYAYPRTYYAVVSWKF